MFSDILIYAKLNFRHRYVPHLIVPLEKCGIQEIDKEKHPNELLVTTSIKDIHLLFADSREKAQWVRRLRVFPRFHDSHVERDYCACEAAARADGQPARR